MGALKEILERLKGNNNIDEDKKTLEEIENAGINDADKIAEAMGQTENKEKFVPKVDVPPVKMPKQKKEMKETDRGR